MINNKKAFLRFFRKKNPEIKKMQELPNKLLRYSIVLGVEIDRAIQSLALIIGGLGKISEKSSQFEIMEAKKEIDIIDRTWKRIHDLTRVLVHDEEYAQKLRDSVKINILFKIDKIRGNIEIPEIKKEDVSSSKSKLTPVLVGLLERRKCMKEIISYLKKRL